ncbi:hypothetical protein IAD21_03989 [Abditibacteriota bacterium]|nr:hypothetical protein IAD21_03989 [Abditibacteriota bacterium]
MGKCYRDLAAWQKAMQLAVISYQLTALFPKHEVYGLASQLQRSAISVPSNIAEGNERESDKEFLHHLAYSLGSLAELETQVELAFLLGYLNQQTIDEFRLKSAEVGRLISGLRRHVQGRSNPK